MRVVMFTGALMVALVAMAGRSHGDEPPAAPVPDPQPTPAPEIAPAPAPPVAPLSAASDLGYERRYRTGLLYPGIAMFAGSYVLTLGLTAAISEDDYKTESIYYVMFPVVGPLGLAASGIAKSGHVAPLLASSALQATGLVLMFLGTRSRIVPRPPARPQVLFVPSLRPGGAVAHVLVSGF